MTLQTNSTGEALGQFASIFMNVAVAILYVAFMLNDHQKQDGHVGLRSINPDKKNKKRLEQVRMYSISKWVCCLARSCMNQKSVISDTLCIIS